MRKKYQAKNGFVKRTIAGEILLVPVGARTQEFNGMIMLNDTGSYLWDLLQTAKDRDELVSLMMKEFNAGADEIGADVDEFVSNGVMEGLITEE